MFLSARRGFTTTSSSHCSLLAGNVTSGSSHSYSKQIHTNSTNINNINKIMLSNNNNNNILSNNVSHSYKWSMFNCLSSPLGSVRGLYERGYEKKQGADTKNLPFLVRRTPSGNLPVYVHVTQDGGQKTRVRHVFGDAEHLAGEVGKLCGAVARVTSGRKKSVELRGAHEKTIKTWLSNLGL